MTEQQASYRQIMKATSLFGGVQMFQIIIQVAKSKIIAILLGTNGIGVIGLLNASIDLISRFTNFGLSVSGVKEIAEAEGKNDNIQISVTTTVIRRLVWITGSLGTISMLAISPWLSYITFGNRHYTLAFIWISITLLLNQVSAGQLLILQGMRKLKQLAKANMVGTLLGVLLTVPLYYYYSLDGIVPGIIITSVITVLLSWFYSHKVQIAKIRISKEQAILDGKRILFMGFMISLSGIVTQATSYGIRIFINNIGGLDQVGLYTAGFTLINTYVGLVFSAMATDYYPRLSSVADNNEKSNLAINQQAEVATLILAPILNVLIVMINIVVIALYSHKFVLINEMIVWAALGMLFKAASWSISFVLLAKGVTKLFFWNELVSNAYQLALSLLGYYLLGLKGIGISFLLSYFIYFIQVYYICNRKYGFVFTPDFLKIFIVQFCLTVFCFISVRFVKPPYHYLPGISIIAASTWYSFSVLNKQIDFKRIVNNLINKS